jgi:hypothetical protein
MQDTAGGGLLAAGATDALWRCRCPQAARPLRTGRAGSLRAGGRASTRRHRTLVTGAPRVCADCTFWHVTNSERNTEQGGQAGMNWLVYGKALLLLSRDRAASSIRALRAERAGRRPPGGEAPRRCAGAPRPVRPAARPAARRGAAARAAAPRAPAATARRARACRRPPRQHFRGLRRRPRFSNQGGQNARMSAVLGRLKIWHVAELGAR